MTTNRRTSGARRTPRPCEFDPRGSVGLAASEGRLNLSDVVAADMAFHRRVVDRPGEPDLAALWLPAVTRMRLVYSRHGDLREVYPEHAVIVERFKAGDIDGAVAALEANIV